MTLSRRSYVVLAIVVVLLAGLSLLNASWIAPAPKGKPRMVADRGLYHQYDRAAVKPGDCTATHIAPVESYVLENSGAAIYNAYQAKAAVVALDIAGTRDGQQVVWHDATLDCRSNGKGRPEERTFAELKALDIGHGYTPDNGATWPLRGKGIGMIATATEAMQTAGTRALIWRFRSDDPAEADRLAAALKAAGRDVLDTGDGFTGPARPVARIRQLIPKAWAWTRQEAEACTGDYRLYGWTGILPASCRNGTMLVPLSGQFTLWGWPNRLIDRMAGANARIIVHGPGEEDGVPRGLTQPEQLGEIPGSFNGYIWVEDIGVVGPALR